MKSKLKSFLKILSLVLLSILLLFNIFAISYRQFNKDEENKVTSLIPFAVLSVESGSMEPEISKGDLVLIYEAPYEDIKVGDNITYLGQDNLITHKVVEINEEYFICKGLENNINDDAVLKNGYCGKVILAIPFLGNILDILDTPINQIILILLVFFAFYGFDLINYLIDLISHKKKENKFKFTFEKPIVMLTAISVILMSPYFTAGKYNKEVNGYTLAVGGVTYFTANYLSESGNSYVIGGWSGDDTTISTFTMNLDIRNYENSLLFNKTEQDIIYKFYFVKDSSAGYKTDYTVSVTSGPEASTTEEFVAPDGWPEAGVADSDIHGPYVITGSDEVKKDTFTIEVKENSATSLRVNDKIKFKIVAATSAGEMFSRKITGTFEFRVTNQGFFSVDKSAVDNVVTYAITTNDTIESNTRKIKVEWNSSELYLNEYDPSVLSIITKNPEYFKRDDGYGKGYIILPMASDSKIALQFFTMEGISAETAASHISAEEVSDVGAGS